MTWKPLAFVFIDDEMRVQRDEMAVRLIIEPKRRIPPSLFPLQCSSPAGLYFTTGAHVYCSYKRLMSK